jgi:hypothetical protein
VAGQSGWPGRTCHSRDQPCRHRHSGEVLDLRLDRQRRHEVPRVSRLCVQLAQAYATLGYQPGAHVKEADTFTCAHCNSSGASSRSAIRLILGGLCKTCMGVICEKCVGGVCDPIMKKIERQEAAGRARRWMDNPFPADHARQASRYFDMTYGLP